MTVLAIDTSSRRRVVCVLAEPIGILVRAVAEEDVDVDRSLPPAIQSLLSEAVSEIAVVVGPGSYTGIRTGMAAALGVAHARGLPLFGVTSLVPVCLAAREVGAQQGWALADAGRGAVYAMPFDRAGGFAGETSRVDLTAVTPQMRNLYSADALPIEGLHWVDAAVGLARAVPVALTRRLPLNDLRAEYSPPP